jgi:adenylate cyclase
VTGYSSEEVAQRAGVDLEYVDQLLDLGILTDGGDGFSSGDVLTARWVRGFDQVGIPLEGMGAAVRDGSLSFSFMDVAAFDRFPGLSTTNFHELSGRTGIPMDLLKVVREAIGFAEPGPDDFVREDELSVVPAIEVQLSNGFSPLAIERWLRVHGSSLRRIAATETEYWKSEIMQPLVDEGMTMGEMMEVQADLGSQIAPLFERALLAIYHGQQEHAWRQGFAEAVEGALERANLYSGLHRPPAICFLDITGYTQLTEERGDEAAAALAMNLERLVRRCSQEHGGQPVKWLGDGVMLYFREPASAVLASLDMVEGVADDGLPPAHIGLHAGPVVFQDGDYFGRTVNLAARIADYARPGEVVVSQAVREAAEGAPVAFEEIGPVELKGIKGSLQLHTARRDI